MRLSFRRYQHINVNSAQEAQVVQIVGDAAIATAKIGHGRLIPLVIIDTDPRPDLAEVIEAQQHLPVGDVEVQWGALHKRLDHVALILRFQRPTERDAIVEFDIRKQGILVEQILESKALYIQAGRVGDRLKDDLNRSKILIEVPETGFRSHWDKIHFNAILKQFRKNGMSRSMARELAQTHIAQMRELTKFRMYCPP